MPLSFEERRKRFYATHDDSKKLVYQLAECDLENILLDEAASLSLLTAVIKEAQRLQVLFEKDLTDHIASQMGLPHLDKHDGFSGNWICKPLEQVAQNEPFRYPLGASGMLDRELWVKVEWVDEKGKWRVQRLVDRQEPHYADFIGVHLSPRFKVYVRDAT